jgi:uncharacterized protein (DUF1015 family)
MQSVHRKSPPYLRKQAIPPLDSPYAIYKIEGTYFLPDCEEDMTEIINDVQPFKAMHYNPKKISEVGLCLSQPYDVISAEQQEAYYKQHEHNVIRLILNKIETGDNETNNRYTRARDLLRKWREADIIHEANRSSFWVYEQAFDIPEIGRKKVKGFIGAVRLQDYDKKRILPHEKVMQKPVEDRIKLTEVTNTQTEYIWGIYQDKAYIIDNILNECEQDAPIVDYLEQNINVRHKLWRLVDPEKCDIISRTMQRLKIYIADGHHRYQTMLTIRDNMRRKYPDAGPSAPWEYIMMFLVNTEHEGLTILPTHRMLHNLNISNLTELNTRIQEHFHVKSYPFTAQDESEVRRRWLRDLNDAYNGEHKFGAYIMSMNRYYLATLKDAEAYEEMVRLDTSSEWKRLDVNILNTLILNKIVGITEEQLSMQTNIEYTKDVNEAIESVRSGKMQVALILNSTRLEDVITIADNNEKMPRKSTHFYPKPVSGLVFYSMDYPPKN